MQNGNNQDGHRDLKFIEFMGGVFGLMGFFPGLVFKQLVFGQKTPCDIAYDAIDPNGYSTGLVSIWAPCVILGLGSQLVKYNEETIANSRRAGCACFILTASTLMLNFILIEMYRTVYFELTAEPLPADLPGMTNTNRTGTDASNCFTRSHMIAGGTSAGLLMILYVIAQEPRPVLTIEPVYHCASKVSQCVSSFFQRCFFNHNNDEAPRLRL